MSTTSSIPTRRSATAARSRILLVVSKGAAPRPPALSEKWRSVNNIITPRYARFQIAPTSSSAACHGEGGASVLLACFSSSDDAHSFLLQLVAVRLGCATELCSRDTFGACFCTSCRTPTKPGSSGSPVHSRPSLTHAPSRRTSRPPGRPSGWCTPSDRLPVPAGARLRRPLHPSHRDLE